MKTILDWLMESPQVRLPLLLALIGLSGVVAGGFLNAIVWPLVKETPIKLWILFETKLSRRKFEYKYLDWVISEHQYLPLLPSTLVPVTQVNVQKLDGLYVSLVATSNKDEQEEIPINKALGSNQALVIIGDPGAGKTTTLRFLALTFAQARRRKTVDRSREKRKQNRIIARKAKALVKKEFGFRRLPLPIFVYLNRLHDVEAWPSSRSLLDALRDEWKAVDVLRTLPEDFFDKKLGKGECIFLLDAFDELGTHQARNAISNHIGLLASSIPHGNRFIVTSRILGYRGQLARYGFNALQIKSLSWNLIRDLITKWYTALNELKLAEPLLDTLRVNPRIAGLAANPMLLSLIALVQYVKRFIPEKRHLLYDECIKILVERRYAHPDVQQTYNRILPGDEATYLLQKIAESFHRARLREVSRHQLEAFLIPKALDTMPNSVASLSKPAELLKNIEERSQILVERGIDENGVPLMAFSHLTFQEYLTSVSLKDEIAKRGERVVNSDLISRYQADHEWWEEVILLYAAQLDNQQRLDFFNKLYPAKE